MKLSSDACLNHGCSNTAQADNLLLGSYVSRELMRDRASSDM